MSITFLNVPKKFGKFLKSYCFKKNRVIEYNQQNEWNVPNEWPFDDEAFKFFIL